MKLYRQLLFSSKKSDKKDDKEEDNNKNKKTKKVGAGLVLVGAGLGAKRAAIKLNTRAWKKAKEGISKSSTDTEENNELRNKLLNKAKSQGISTLSDDDYKNAAYLGTPTARSRREEAIKSGTLKEFQEDESKRYRSKVIGENLGTDAIVTGKGFGKSPEVIAHEMGHGAMSVKGRSKDIIGKAAHSKLGTTLDTPRALLVDHEKTDDKDIKTARKLAKTALVLGGMSHGMKYDEKIEKGDKKGARKEIAKGLGVGALIAVPQLITEGAATRKGLKYMKEVGASKEQMKNARKTLGHALGTYASTSLIPIGLEATGMGLGIGTSRLIKKLDKNKKSKKEKEDNKKSKNKD